MKGSHTVALASLNLMQFLLPRAPKCLDQACGYHVLPKFLLLSVKSSLVSPVVYIVSRLLDCIFLLLCIHLYILLYTLYLKELSLKYGFILIVTVNIRGLV